MPVYFPSNLKFLREAGGLSQGKAAAGLGLNRSTYANYETGATQPEFEFVEKIVQQSGRNAQELLFTDLAKGNLAAKNQDNKNRQKGNLNADFDLTMQVSEPPPIAYFVPKVITVDSVGVQNMVYVPVRAERDYLGGYGNPEYVATLPSFSLPMLQNGTFRMFDVAGISMVPTIQPGQLICQAFDEGLNGVKDNQIYLLVTTGGIIVKRLLNRISERGKLILKSDTTEHRIEYPTREIDFQIVREIWRPCIKMSSDFSDPSSIYNKLAA